MSSNLKVNNILPSTGTTVAVSGIASVTSSVSIASSCTATTFFGSGANLTSLPAQATIANNADNRVITGGSGVNLNGEANFTYDGNLVSILSSANQADGLLIHNTNNSQAHADAAVMISGGDNASAFLRLENNSQKFEIIKDANHNLLVEDDGTERLRIASNGLITVNRDGVGGRIDATAGDSSIKISDGNGRSSIKVSDPGSGNSYEWELTSAGNFKAPNGKGIDFSANSHATGMSSELLNDYEEGSWNPTYVTQGGNLGSVTYTNQYGYYVKIGHTVWVMIDITIASASGMSGNPCIGNHPFNSNIRHGQGNYYSGTSNWYIQNHANGKPIFTGWMPSNSNIFRMHNGDHWGSVPNAPLNTTGRLSFSHWYTTNS